jgi:Tfp pilus assembly protein PilF
MDKIEKLREFLTSSPNDAFLQHALALEYVKLGDDQLAKELFTVLLERNPDYVGSYYHLAKLLERQEDTGQAIVWYEKGMSVAKARGDQHAYNELHAAYEELLY